MKKHQPLPVYDTKILLEYPGAHLDTDMEGSALYMEARAKQEPICMESGSKSDAMIVTFKDPVDIEQLQIACSEKPFNRKTVSVSEIPVSCSLYVEGSIDEETVQNYFENRRSGNTCQSEVTVEVLDDGRRYLVHFEDCLIIDKVLTVRHVINSEPLKVRQYHKSVEVLPLSEITLKLDGVADVIGRFLINSPLIDVLKTKLKTYGISLSIKEDHQIYITVPNPPGDINFVSTAKMVFREIVDHQALCVPPELKDVVTVIIRQEVQEIDPRYAKCYTDSETVSIVGHHAKVPIIKDRLETRFLIAKRALDIRDKPQDVETVVRQETLERLQLLYLKEMSIESEFKTIKVQILLEEEKIHLEGVEPNVNEALTKIFGYVNSAERNVISIDPEHLVTFFQKEAVKDAVFEKIRRDELVASWEPNQSTVETLSKSPIEAKKLEKILRKSVNERHIPISSNMHSLLEGSSWKKFMLQLRDVFTDKFEMNRGENGMDIYGLTEAVDGVHDQVKEFFRNKEVILTVPDGVFRFIKLHCIGQLDKISGDLKAENVKIEMKESKLFVRATEIGIKQAREQLQHIIDGVAQDKLFMKEASMMKLLQTKGRKVADEVEEMVPCAVVIRNETSQEEPLPRESSSQDDNDQPPPVPLRKYRPCLVKGQIGKEKVDIIVNSTNQSLKLDRAGAVSVSLAQAAGPDLQAECTRDFPDGIHQGDIAITGGGRLQCESVYHVFLPENATGIDAEEKVKDIVKKCLSEGSKRQKKSIAFPALGTGQLKYDRSLVAASMVNTIQEFWTQNPSSTLKDVRIVLYDKDEETIRVFEETNRDKIVVIDKVKRIAQQEVDVIVNTTSQNLDLKKSGAVSMSLLEAGGEDLQKQCNKHSEGIKPGAVAVTGPAKLPCKKVYHICLPQVSGTTNPREEVSSIVKKILVSAHQDNARSIAFPALGTGGLKYDRALVAQTMLQTIHKFRNENPGTSLRKIVIVVFDAKTTAVFEATNRDVQRGSSPNPATRKPKVIQGTITTCKADVIVNPTDTNLSLQRGRLSKSISQAAGPTVEKECKDKYPHGLRSGELAVTSAGLLKAKRIYHIQVPDYDPKSGDENLRNAVTVCLEEAHRGGYESLLFPALGVGLPGYESSVSAKNILQTIGTFWRKHPTTTLTDITIVVFEDETKKVFQSALGSFRPVVTTLREGRKLKKFDGEDKQQTVIYSRMGTGSKISVSREVTFFGDSRENLQTAKRKFLEAFKKELASKTFEIGTFSAKNRQELENKAQQLGVDLNWNTDDGKFEMTALKSDLPELIEIFYKIQLEQKEFEALASKAQWCFLDEHNEAVKYPSEISLQLEKAFMNKGTNTHIMEDTNGTRYVVDFTNMEEYEESDPLATWPVLRKTPMKDGEFDFPVTWKSGVSENLTVCPIDRGSKEYEDISAKFASTNKEIVKIERIQNKTLYKQYQAKKQAFEQRTTNTRQVERELWHGTAVDAVNSINKDGFNRSYCGKNATNYGMGVYFAVNASYSTQERYSKPDATGNRYIYLVNVLTGEYIMGNKLMRVPPPIDPSNPEVRYDSTVENVNHPTMYVIYNDTQAYPKYLITFK